MLSELFNIATVSIFLGGVSVILLGVLKYKKRSKLLTEKAIKLLPTITWDQVPNDFVHTNNINLTSWDDAYRLKDWALHLAKEKTRQDEGRVRNLNKVALSWLGQILGCFVFVSAACFFLLLGFVTQPAVLSALLPPTLIISGIAFFLLLIFVALKAVARRMY